MPPSISSGGFASVMKHFVVRSLSVLVFMMICVQTLPAQNSLPADLDSYVARVLKTFEVPGLAVAIVKDGGVVLAKGYAGPKLGETTPVDDNTLFGIVSNTKPFTSPALATWVS